MSTVLRPAVAADLDPLKALVESAYRGDTARAGWCHEADLLTNERIARAGLAALLAAPDQCTLVGEDDGAMIGCVSVTRPTQDGGPAYIGLLAVSPTLQAGGLGRQLLTAAEDHAREAFGARRAEMTVVSVREPLIAYYQRRGYAPTGERRPFPDPAITHLEMVVLARGL